jgi:predicted TIM-barrel fold metal-dependent hydrolase
MPVIDAHVHVLDSYRPMAPFDGAGRVDRLLHWMDDAGVDKAVMLPVVADFSPHNNEECGRWAREHPDRLAAMTDVALNEAEAPDRVRSALDAHGAVAISCYPSTPDLAWMTAPEHEPLWAAFLDTGLVCNLQVTPPNYPFVLEVARRYPQVTFVLNHFGLPKGAGIAPDDSDYGGLSEAAGLANVNVKISAHYSVADTAWDVRCPTALAYIDCLLSLLGASRLLFGSDWPPAARRLTYRQNVEVVRSAADLSDADRAAILGDNAARVFQI